ncbi:carboxylesterase family protein [Eisenibacter elegans]|uniref:carboxylesterase family protein n=1 Tax=Eisenibacter elegans TaxID=997 RepID=UPI003CCC14F3
MGKPSIGQDEHCQELSITLPRTNSTAPLPVMVWIHGGSYTSGAAKPDYRQYYFGAKYKRFANQLQCFSCVDS